MRATIAFLAAIFLASAASAQTGGRIGAYYLGMSADEARALRDQLPRALPDEARSTPDAILGVTEYEGLPLLVEANATENAVHTLTMFNYQFDVSAQQCLLLHSQLSRGLARDFGPLNKPMAVQRWPIATEDFTDYETGTADIEPDVRTLTDGTVIGVYHTPTNGMWHYISEHEGAQSVNLASHFTEGPRPTCRISISAWDQALRDSAHAVAPQAAAPTQSEEVRAALSARIASAERLTDPTFTQEPPSPIWRFYPQAAVMQRQPGDVVADCLVGADGALECLIVTEDPLGFGFGEAALQIFAAYRVDVSNGEAGKCVRMRMPFRFS